MDPSSRGVPRRDGIRHARRVSNWTAAGTTGTSAAAGPQVTHSVATTTASGVTVTTTTRTVNGKIVVTRVKRAPAGRDD